MKHFKLLMWQFTIEKFSKYSQVSLRKNKDETIIDLLKYRIYVERRNKN